MNESKQMNGEAQSSLRGLLQFSVFPPRHLIQFKNKSEEEYFMRIGHRIYSLHTQTKDEVMYTYQRVFKYLMETLTPDEFEHLPFQSVNKLIDVIFKTKI
jgi:hypothetical protein